MNPIAVDPLAILKALNRADNRNKPINDGFRIVDDSQAIDSHDHVHRNDRSSGKRSIQPVSDKGCCSKEEKPTATGRLTSGASKPEIDFLPEIDLSKVNVFDPESIAEFLDKGYLVEEPDRKVDNTGTLKTVEKQTQSGQDLGSGYLDLDLMFRDLKMTEPAVRKAVTTDVSAGSDNREHQTGSKTPVDSEQKEGGCCGHNKDTKEQLKSTVISPLSQLDLRIERERPEIVNPSASSQAILSRGYVPDYLEYRASQPSIDSQTIGGLLTRHHLQHHLDRQYPGRSSQRFPNRHQWLHHERGSLLDHSGNRKIGSSVLHSLIPHNRYRSNPLRYHHHH